MKRKQSHGHGVEIASNTEGILHMDDENHFRPHAAIELDV